MRPKKSLGQNFLNDPNLLKKIVDIGKISKEDTILDTGNLNFMLLIYCILSFLIGWKYSKLKYFLFLILFLFYCKQGLPIIAE